VSDYGNNYGSKNDHTTYRTGTGFDWKRYGGDMTENTDDYFLFPGSLNSETTACKGEKISPHAPPDRSLLPPQLAKGPVCDLEREDHVSYGFQPVEDLDISHRNTSMEKESGYSADFGEDVRVGPGSTDAK
jgi:hypothetical protein